MDDLFCYIQTVHFHTLLSYHLYIFVSLTPPLKMFRINLKKASLWWALLSILVNLVGTIEPFCGKNEALRWIMLVGKQKRNVQRANPILTSACQLTITWVSNINTSNSLDSSQGFFLLGPRSHWGEDPSWNLTSAYMEGRPYGRTILSRAKFLDA